MIDPNRPPPPRQLGLNANFRPQGYYTHFKQWPIYPNSSNMYWNPNDVIRFYNTIDQGVMDPYRSSIIFTVQTSPQTSPVGQLQIDKWAASFFSQVVISSRNVQIQRMTQWDSLNACFTDIGTSQILTQGRTMQGMGFNGPFSQTNQMSSQSYASSITTVGPGDNSWILDNVNQSGYNPTRVGAYGGRGNFGPIQQPFPIQSSGPWQVSGNTGANCTIANYLWMGPGNYQGVTGMQALTNLRNVQGRFNNVRAQYVKAMTAPNYPDSPSSILQNNPTVGGQTWQTDQMFNMNAGSGFNPKCPYKIWNNPTTNFFGVVGDPKNPNIYQVPKTPSLFGYTKPICSQTCKSANQATISPTVPLCQMYQGLILPTKQPVSQRTFQIPFMSSTVGALIPPDQFLLIQMKALKDLLIQMTLSPYGMFTSGYCDVHQFDQVGMGTMQKRAWTISNISWNLHLYTFQQTQITRALNASLVKGIAITSSFYQLGNTFQLPNGSVIRNSWPINCQSQSLSQIWTWFYSNQHQKYTGCRKQFRLSNNITSMQIRLKTKFYPTQPITGNAGNPQPLRGQKDNTNFYKLLMLSNNYVFNLNIPMPKINKTNFAINGRIYNPSNNKTYYDPNMWQNKTYQWTSSSVNMDTAMGMQSFNQNNWVGMAIYAWTWDPYGHSTEYMNGISAAGQQNMAIQFTNSASNQFPSDQTMVIYCRSNGIVLYTQNGIQVVGK